MATVLINDEYLTDIAVAIRTKNNSDTTYKPKEMAEAILAIEGGGSAAPAVIEALTITENGTYTAPEGVDGYSPITVDVAAVAEGIPPEAFIMTGDCTYRLAYNGWTWFVNTYGDQMTSKDITSLSSFASNSKSLIEIPFDLNITKNCTKCAYAFYECHNLISAPRIVGQLNLPTSNYSGTAEINSLFNHCRKIKEIPYDYFYTFGGIDYWTASQQYTGGNRSALFSGCYSLRALPDISMLKNKAAYYNCLYSSLCSNCYSLDEVRNLVVIDGAELTGDALGSAFQQCQRLKSLTFETNEDGSPKIAKWKNQKLDLTYDVGYCQSGDKYIMEECGNSLDKRVGSDESYQA